MKIKLKKSGIVIAIMLLIIAISVAIIPNFIVTLINDVIKKNPASAWTLNFGGPESLGIIHGDTRTTIEWEGTKLPPEQEITGYKELDGKTVPYIDDKTQLYCTDYGTDFWASNTTRYSIDILKNYGSITSYKIGNPNIKISTTNNYSIAIHNLKEYDGAVSNPWLVKSGDRDMITAEDIDLAYILTSVDIGQYNEKKQRAIWAKQKNDETDQLYSEAKQYAKYYEKTQMDGTGGSTDLPNINIQGSVNNLKVMAHYDEENDGTITIGPINLTYRNNNNDKVAFAGISNMYFKGYNLKGEEKKNIQIEKYIGKDGKEKGLSFFKPEANSFVDHTEQSYPDGTESFYVVIKNPNIGKTSADDEFVSQLDLYINFRWMTILDARASDMNSYQYTVQWEDVDNDGYYTGIYWKDEKQEDGTVKKVPVHYEYFVRTCTTTSSLKEENLQSVLNYYGGARELFGTTVNIKGINITMDLGGNVWEDGVTTKETKADGVNNTSEQDGKKVDKSLSGIKVNLWACNKNGENEKFVTYTYTDENGNYIFENINSLLKYYVTFEYNGQTYLPTEYLNTGEGQYNSVEKMLKEYTEEKKRKLDNETEWKVTSKGTETASIREEYNKKFAEIGSAPKNYLSSDSLQSGQLVEGYNEVFSTYDLMGFVLGEDGKYSIDQNLALIDGFYTVKDGVIIETDELQEGLISKKIKEYIAEYETKEKARLQADLDQEFDDKIKKWNQDCNKYLNDPDVKNLEGQRANGINVLNKQKAARLEYIEKLNIIMPDYNKMIKEVYNEIYNEIIKEIREDDKIKETKTEMWRKFQFIEDCKITSCTQNQKPEKDLYPIYDDIYINRVRVKNNKAEFEDKTYDDPKIDPIKAKQDDEYDKTKIMNKYEAIYPGQFFVNQGLWRRQEFDAALRKDVYKATLKINDKTVVYNYDKRSDDDKYWDINVRMSDYDNYYNTGYNREVYKTDCDYNSEALKHPGADLEIYVTYKITIRNQSQSIMTQIKEVVDYYDKDYTYRDDLSWVTYKEGEKNNTVTDKEYYDAMAIAPSKYSDEMKQNLATYITNARKTQVNKNTNTDESKYGSSTHSDITKTYQAVYINGLKDKKLATGESAYIYLTFQVNKDKDGKVILDEERNNNDATPKQNIAEINGYATYYKDYTKLPNGISKTSGDIAGLLDRDSNPGNLTQRDITNKDEEDKYEKNFEDDTDRAKSLRILIDDKAVRKVNGTVWEDKRNTIAGESAVGDGFMQEEEKKIAGVEVQLVEKLTNGAEYIWYQTETDQNGYYEFENYIPGNYIVRFNYGNNINTVKINGNGGSNDVSYNGQDFKSTTYQAGMTQNDITNTYETNTSKQYKGYKDIDNQNETGTYGYDIYQADKYDKRVSDAKDIWSRRLTVNDYSNDNTTNHIAEVLASPYEIPSEYTEEQVNSLINDLITYTYMTAETGVIDVEFEYDRQLTDGNNKTSNNSDKYLYINDFNGNFTLNNIDFGLTERPKAQLEIDKSIANIKVTLANNSVLFDVNKAGDNVIWKEHEKYNLASKKNSNGIYEDYYGITGKNRYSYREVVNEIVKNADKGLIQLTMDEELMHGATIEITYKVKVTNVGEVDYKGEKFYYLGDSTGAEKVTTTANQVIDYVANNLQFNKDNEINAGWTVADRDDLTNSGIVNNNLSDNLKKFNNIILTEGLNKALAPGESTEKALALTQLITAENKSDDLTYNNIVEIVKTSNTVGRRMAYSVVGNQDPTAEAAEVDSSRSEKVIILPPFGEIHIYYILAAIVAIILIGGITLIIKKVLKK